MLRSTLLLPARLVRSRVAAAFFAVALIGVLAITGASDGSAASNDATVRTVGGTDFRANKIVFSTLRFKPGNVRVASGGTLTLKFADRDQDPHSLTIVNEDEVPDTVDEVFNCAPCNELFSVLPDPPPAFFDAPGTGPGIDGRLDSLWVNPGETASAQVTAPAGSELDFVCAIHAWMQGTIKVTGGNRNGDGDGDDDDDD